MKFHLVLGLFYVFLHDINYGIEFMFIKFTKNVKVGVTTSHRIRIARLMLIKFARSVKVRVSARGQDKNWKWF